MSLVTLLAERDSLVKQFLEAQFPYTRPVVREQNKRLASTATIRPEGPLPPHTYAMLGRAIDYRIRYYFPPTPVQDLVAWRGGRRVMDGERPLEDIDLLRERDVELFQGEDGAEIVAIRTGLTLPAEAVQEFFDSLETFLSTYSPAGRRLYQEEEELLTKYCIVLSCFEQIARSGPHPNDRVFADNPKTSVSELLSIAEDEWTADICAMSWLFHDRCQTLLSSPAILNPIFAGSADVGGADADLIVDGCLIDIKATVNAELSRNWLYQLLGYSLLDYDDEFDIREVGIYFARQGVTLQWSLEGLMEHLRGGPPPPLIELRKRFQETITQ